MNKTKLITTLLLSFTLCACSSNGASESSNKVNEPVKEEIHYYAPLSGIETEKNISKEPVFAVMIDNHPDATPQSGLNDAEIIYEFKAEGEYTRFMALFMKNHVDVLGPVRSARPYFVDTAKEYDAIYAHWGGSDAGYMEIETVGLKDLDGIYLEGSTYYRNKEVKKKRPHDGYTSYDLLYSAAKDFNYLEDLKEVKGFKFDTSENLDTLNLQMGDSPATKLSLDFFKHYNMTFEYNEETKTYLPIRNGENVIDERDGSNVSAKNIILEFAKSSITGPKDTLTIEHIGSGNGKLFTQGKVIDITWEKPSKKEKTIFKTTNGEEIILAPGLTFIEVLDPTDNVLIEPVIQTQESAS
ncbi:DUF3048 domain-containing protein [Peptoniphilus sp. oral taxon 386]|uniref:DUF3048 domain-containing protein n=1 Tax=Peptoniphilus sp. oral taxon 386 TaxID=652713 RepID=UPI0001DAA0DB|nr:DUF3048 domain-containing protein [Peptoniphilus sp. oral taxon 386]EFI41666.1 hypothetical protein HMPREF0629_00289 [Peptoniphilus sp. oral taxon 386 str. F0131]